MAIELYPHNQETYEKMTEMFKTMNRVGAVQPTGTGKSFLILRWIYDHPNDKFIVLSPSVDIFMQFVGYAKEAGCKELLNSVRMLSYQSLIRMSDEKIRAIKADKFVVDEFHRTGAFQWGPALLKLLEANPDSKVFGVSATPVRYCDGFRDMASELFDRNLAVEMTLGEAVAKGILPTPTYVPVWYDYDDKLKQYQEDIDLISDPEERAELSRTLKQLKNNLQNAYGAEDVFAKHMPSNHGKYIVFCRNYEHLQEMLGTMRQWLSKVNSNIHSYVSISRESDRDEQLDAFRNDKSDDAVKLLFTIDRLNEGLHVKDIDGVIMLRPTTSPIIYLQQMGRALSVKKGARPIIFDMVNNYMNAQVQLPSGEKINVFENEFKEFISKSNNRKSKDDLSERFGVYDQMIAFSEIFNGLEKTLYPNLEVRWKKNYALLKEFVGGHNRLPSYVTIYKGQKIGSWIKQQETAYKEGRLLPEQERLLRDLGVVFEKTRTEERWEKNYALLKEFVEKHGRPPVQTEVYKGANIGVWFRTQKIALKKGRLPSEYECLLRDLGVDFKTVSLEERWEKNYALLKEFVEEHNRLPSQTSTYKGQKIGSWIKQQETAYKEGRLLPEQERLLRDLGFVFEKTRKEILDERWQLRYALLKEFVEKHGRLPAQTESYKGDNVGSWLCEQKTAHKDGRLLPEREHLLCALGVSFGDVLTEQWQEKYNLLKEFFGIYGRLPVQSECYKGVSLGQWYILQKQNFKNGRLLPERERLLRALGVSFSDLRDEQWREKYDFLKEFFDIYGRLPTQSECYKGVRLGQWLSLQKQNFKNSILKSEYEHLLRELGFEFESSQKDAFEERWQKKYELFKEFIKVHGRLPKKEEAYNGDRVGGWFFAQRNSIKAGKLSSERERLLRELGVDFETMTIQRNGCLADLVEDAEKRKSSNKLEGLNCNKPKKYCPEALCDK